MDEVGADSVERYGKVIFSQGRADEATRLQAITDTYDATTQMRLGALGMRSTWRCIEVGAGSGTIAAWLAEQLAPTEVVALDRDTRLLERTASQHPNLRVVQADLTTIQAPPAPGAFDLVYARFVLMHLPARFELLRRLATWLTPGGWLVLSDSIDLTTPTSEYEPYQQVMTAMWATLRATIGSDITWVRAYPRLLREQRLHNVGAEVYLPSVDHQSPVTRFWALTWQQMRDRLVDSGQVTTETVDAAIAAMGDQDFTELSPGMITAWGQRP